jgi:glycosyltransferase involved in cell wall biosynthesis
MPQTRTHLAIVIPVYNEGAVIRDVINSIPKTLTGINKITILAVNDGSTDNSVDDIKKTRAILIDLPINLGYGGANITGLEAAKILKADIIVTFDGDGQHDPGEIKKIIQPILDDKADFVVGVRKINFKKMPKIKKIGNWGMSFFTSILSRRWTTDSQSGFKAFSKNSLAKINIDTLGYEFCSEMIIEASRAKLRVKEIPIRTIYSQYSMGKGQSILNGINIIFKLMFKKITG